MVNMNAEDARGVAKRFIDRWYRNPQSLAASERQRWLSALKTISWRTAAFGQPAPGIESLAPSVADEGSPTLTLIVNGLDFTGRSVVVSDGAPVPVIIVNENELHVTITGELIANVGMFPISVKNPDPLQAEEFGRVSNRVFLPVRFR